MLLISTIFQLFWPKSRYRSDLEKRFRSLPCNVVELQIRVHDLIHAYQEPPTKPYADEMIKAIENHDAGRCPCASRQEPYRPWSDR